MLTLNTWHLRQDDEFVSAFLHEELHWYLVAAGYAARWSRMKTKLVMLSGSMGLTSRNDRDRKRDGQAFTAAKETTWV
jgi:hypothetical protein